MIGLSQGRRPIMASRAALGQFSSFINPFEIAGEAPSTTLPPGTVVATNGPEDITRPIKVLSGLALTGLSALTAYVGISYGLERRNSELQRGLGWTVGVISALSGLVRLAATSAMMIAPTTMAGRRA